MGKKRIEWIDVSKGIGILLVIVGHCVYYGGFVHNWIFSFHMPLFFILSGLLFSGSSFVVFLKNKTRQLLIPYIVFCMIGLIISLLVPSWRGFSYKDIFTDIYCGYPNSINISSIWFLICLFISELLLNTILLIQKKNRVVGWFILIILIAIGFIFGRIPSLLASFPNRRLPIEIDCSFVALMFLAFGFYFREKILLFEKSMSNRASKYSMIGLFISTAIIVIIALLNRTVNLHAITYNNEVLYISGSIAGFFLVVFLSIISLKIQIIKRLFSWLGKNSLKIMGVQAIVSRIYLLFINKLTNNNFRLYFLPPLYAIVGCIAVTALTTIIVVIYNNVKQKIPIYFHAS